VASKEAEEVTLGGAGAVSVGLGPVGGLMGMGERRAFGLEMAEAKAPLARRRRESLFRRLLLSADLLAMLAALGLAVAVVPRELRLDWDSALALPLIVMAAKLSGLYDRDDALLRKTTLDEAPKLFQLATLCVLVVWLGDRSILGAPLGRVGALLLWLALTLFVVLARACARRLALRLAEEERCLFIGALSAERRVRAKLKDGCGTKARIVAHLDLQEAAPWSDGTFTAEQLADIREVSARLGIHRAIVAPGAVDGGDMLELVCALNACGVRVSVLPRLLEAMGSSVEFDDLHGMTVMGLRRFSLTRSTEMVKRAFDVLTAGLLLLLCLPLMIAAAVAIKLDSRGPVLFRQLRVGRHGERFKVLKFRTMILGAETMRAALADRNEAQDGLFKIADDPRITRVGAVLRRTCLDELPQLFNVLRGEMSLVGPRPLVVEEDVRVQGRLRLRLQLLPGITGHWQILGPARVPLREMAAIDYLYVGNWSLWTDVKVLLRTVLHVLARRGL
jgi:exopolysaccharide biosynthesis polyprenyl glycosylphosphotransferase